MHDAHPEHPLTVALRRLVDLVDQLPEPTPQERDRAATRAALNRARNTNRRRAFKPGQRSVR